MVDDSFPVLRTWSLNLAAVAKGKLRDCETLGRVTGFKLPRIGWLHWDMVSSGQERCLDGREYLFGRW
jgi:hypothetical protein